MTMNKKVVTRFAPSNTGSLHAGSARTALFSMAFARKHGGECILRIEDTDAKRSTHESLIDILSGLDWLGLHFDKGVTLSDVQKGVMDERYFQSKRTGRYNEIVDKLVAEDKAYVKDGAVWLRMPKMNTVFNDVILGKIELPGDQCEDFVIRKADGNAVFHLSVCVDDFDMGVTHVIRGADHISNTFKHLRIFEAIGAEVPNFAHIPLILDDKGAKLSKRRTDQCVLIKDFKQAGYLPETVINYLALLGWSPGKGNEIFDMDFIFQNFDLSEAGKTNARFDYKKLANINSTRIEQMDSKRFGHKMTKYAEEYYPAFLGNAIYLDVWDKLLNMYQPRSKTLKDMFDNAKNLLLDKMVYDQEAVDKILKKQGGYGVLAKAVEHIKNIESWDMLDVALGKIAESLGISMGKIAQPVRVALTGNSVSPPIDQVMMMLGKNECLKRIENCLAMVENTVLEKVIC